MESASGRRSVLEIRGLTRRFGGLTAVDRFDVDVNEGEIVSLVGPNGAGKTTVFNLISGVLRPTAGSPPPLGPALLGVPAHPIPHQRVGLPVPTLLAVPHVFA